MELIQYSIWKSESGNASGKAKKDASVVAGTLGLRESFVPSDVRIFRIFQQILSLYKFRCKNVVFLQYPAISTILLSCYNIVKSKEAYSVALVHDLESIRLGNSHFSIKKELKYLNMFDCLIVHNFMMEKYIREIGYTGQTISLEIFDYLIDSRREIKDEKYTGTIAFAGNLKKSSFLFELGKVYQYDFILYGHSESTFSNIDNVNYAGVLGSDEIPYMLDGDYGLVWDGDTLQTCSGLYGSYLRYNNPHKASLYFAAGKPVIVWREAAIAKFVEQHEIGITIDSLEELNSINLKEPFEKYKKNVLALRKEIICGDNLRNAIKKSLSFIELL